jgi:glycosyltransferase involved in cell wall biosynthesis
MKKKKHILCVIGQLGNGGSEKQLYLFLKYLDNSAYSATVFVSGPESGVWAERIKENAGCEVIIAGDCSQAVKIIKFRKVLQRNKTHIVISWSYYTNLLKFLTPGILFIGSLRQQYSEALELYGTLRTRLCRSTDLMIVNSSLAAEELKKYSYPEKQIKVIYNIFAPPNYTLNRETSKKELCSKIGIPENKIIVMGIGGIGVTKNFPFFVNVLKRAAKINPNLHGVIIGAGEKNIKHLLDNKLNNHLITTVGEVSSAQEWLYGADIFFLSSKQEGMPNVMLEAINAGVVTLATDVGGIRDIYKYMPENLLNKVLLADFDVNTAAEKLANLAANPERHRMITKFTAKFLSELQPERIMEQYYKVLNNE